MGSVLETGETGELADDQPLHPVDSLTARRIDLLLGGRAEDYAVSPVRFAGTAAISGLRSSTTPETVLAQLIDITLEKNPNRPPLLGSPDVVRDYVEGVSVELTDYHVDHHDTTAAWLDRRYASKQDTSDLMRTLAAFDEAVNDHFGYIYEEILVGPLRRMGRFIVERRVAVNDALGLRAGCDIPIVMSEGIVWSPTPSPEAMSA